MGERNPVLIAGAGIAGLTTALALARRDVRSILIERADHLAEFGAGLQLSPNASRILLALGLGERLSPMEVRPEAIVIRSAVNGRDIGRIALGEGLRRHYGAPYMVLHRGDLQQALLAAVAAEPRIMLHLGAHVESAANAGTAIDVSVAFGERTQTLRAEALIGADGVRSSVRTRLLDGPEAVYSGRTAWRATFPAADWQGDPEVLTATGLWLGPHAHLVHYPIRGGREINLVAVVDQRWIDDRWDAPGEAADLEPFFGAWPELARALMARARSWRRWALCGVPSSTVWNSGRIALAGDAAHAMLPFVAQGGAMAIEDAQVLARLIADGDGPMSTRLSAYASLRRRRTASVVAQARRNATTYHLSGMAASARDCAMRLLGNGRLADRMDWIWGWRDRP